MRHNIINLKDSQAINYDSATLKEKGVFFVVENKRDTIIMNTVSWEVQRTSIP